MYYRPFERERGREGERERGRESSEITLRGELSLDLV